MKRLRLLVFFAMALVIAGMVSSPIEAKIVKVNTEEVDRILFNGENIGNLVGEHDVKLDFKQNRRLKFNVNKVRKNSNTDNYFDYFKIQVKSKNIYYKDYTLRQSKGLNELVLPSTVIIYANGKRTVIRNVDFDVSFKQNDFIEFDGCFDYEQEKVCLDVRDSV